MPRPSTRTPLAAASLVSRLAEGESLDEAIQAAGLSRAVFFRWQAEDPNLACAINEAKSTGAIFLFWHQRYEELRRIEARERKEREVLLYALETGDCSGLSPSRVRLVRSLRRALREPAPGFEIVPRVGKDGVLRRHIWREPKSRGRGRPCGAKTRKGTPCRCQPEPGKTKCRLHGGKSTGPRTEAGREAIRESNRKRSINASLKDTETS